MAAIPIKKYINYDKNDRQQEALKYIGTGAILFYGGARGGGKSYFGISSAILACLQYPGIQAMIVRKSYNELQDVFIQHLRKYFPPEVFRYKYRDKDKSVLFDNGSRITFRSCETRQDVEKIQGVEFQYLVMDEANNYDYKIITSFLGSLRRSSDMDFIPTCLLTGNPGGRSDVWFKTRFVQPNYDYWTPFELKRKERYVFVSAKATDNPYLNEEYHEMLDALPEDLRRAWKEGEWNSFEGQFFAEWNDNVHTVDDFDVPSHWQIQCGFDLGYTKDHPSVCLWTAQDPKTLDVYVIREYEGYGNSVAIYADELEAWMDEMPATVMWADPSMFDTSIKAQESDDNPAFYFMRAGIPIERADNNRINGWRHLKQWLHWTKRHEPKLKVFKSCTKLIEMMPNFRYDTRGMTASEDLDTNQMLDDYADALRYVMKTGYIYPTGVETEYNKMLAEDEEAIAKAKNRSHEELMKRYSSLNPDYEPMRLNFAMKNRETYINPRARY